MTTNEAPAATFGVSQKHCSPSPEDSPVGQQVDNCSISTEMQEKLQHGHRLINILPFTVNSTSNRSTHGHARMSSLSETAAVSSSSWRRYRELLSESEIASSPELEEAAGGEFNNSTMFNDDFAASDSEEDINYEDYVPSVWASSYPPDSYESEENTTEGYDLSTAASDYTEYSFLDVPSHQAVWHMIRNIAHVNAKRAAHILVQLFLLLAFVLGSTIELTSKLVHTGIVTIVVLLSYMNLLRIYRSYRSHRKRIRRKRLREPTGMLEAIYFYLYNVDKMMLLQNSRSSHVNTSLPADVYSTRINNFRARTKSIRLIRSAAAAKNEKLIRVKFSPSDLAGERLYISGTVCGIDCPDILVDIGSQATVISEHMVRRLEGLLGRPLTRMQSDHRLVGVSDAPVSNLGIVNLDICLENSDGTSKLLLESIPAYTTSSQFSLLLGTNVLNRLEFSITCQGPVAYIGFKRLPQFGNLTAHIKENEFQILELESNMAQFVPPKVWQKYEFTLPNSSRVRYTNVDKKKLIVEKAEYAKDLDIKFSDITEMKNGRATIYVQNTSREAILFPPHVGLFAVSKLENFTSVDISSLATIPEMDTLTPSFQQECQCSIKDSSTVIIVCNHTGHSHIGESPLTLRERVAPTYGIVREGKYYFMIPDRYEGFSALTAPYLSSFYQKNRDKIIQNRITFLMAEPLMADKHFYDCVLELRRYAHVKILYADPARMCRLCRLNSLSSLVSYRFISHVKILNLIIPSSNGFSRNDMTINVFQKMRGHPLMVFSILNDFYVHVYLNSYREISVYLHCPEIKTFCSMFTRNIVCFMLSELKKCFPYIILRVLSNLPDEPNSFEDSIAKGLLLSRHIPAYESGIPTPNREKVPSSDEAEFADVFFKSCSCTLCVSKRGQLRPRQKLCPLRVIYEGMYPTFSDRDIKREIAKASKYDSVSKSTLQIATLMSNMNDNGENNAKDCIDPHDNYSLAEHSVVSQISQNMCTGKQPLPDQLLAVSETMLTPQAIFTPVNDSLYSSLPIPRTTHVPVSIDQIDDYVDFSLVSDSRFINPLRLLLFLSRDCLKLHDSDYGLVRHFLANIKLKSQFVGTRFHSKGYNLACHLLPALREVISNYVNLGIWELHQKIRISSPIFIVLRSSRYKSQGKGENAKGDNGDDKQSEIVLTASNLQDITPKDIRVVVDCMKVNTMIENEYSNFQTANLTAHDISFYTKDSSYLSELDISLSYNSVPVKPADRELLGLKLGKLEPLRSCTLLMGLSNAPSIFNTLVQKVLTRQVLAVSINYFDDFLLSSKPMPLNNEMDRTKNDASKGKTKCQCGTPTCPGCDFTLLQSEDQVKQKHFDNCPYPIHSIPPSKKYIIDQMFELYDPGKFLPKEIIVQSYFTYPLNKGQIYSNCLTAPLRSYPCKIDDDYNEEQAKQHFINLAHLFACIRISSMKLSVRKTRFFAKTVNFFGHAFDKEFISILPEKKLYLNKFREITTVKQVQRFLGSILSIGFHLNGLAHLTRMLYNSTTQAPSTLITPLQRDIVLYIIDKIAKGQPLKILPEDVPMIIIADSSAVASGICVGYEDKQGKFHVTSYYSISLPPCLCSSLSAIEKELYGIASYVLSSPNILIRKHPCIIICDNRSLITMAQMDELPHSGRLYKVLNLLRSLPLRLRFRWRPGENGKVKLSDSLSRLTSYSYFMPGSINSREIKSQIDRQIYTEDLTKVLLPLKAAESDWDIQELPMLLQLYDRDFFPNTKLKQAQTKDEFISKIQSMPMQVTKSMCDQELSSPPVASNDPINDFIKYGINITAQSLRDFGVPPNIFNPKSHNVQVVSRNILGKLNTHINAFAPAGMQQRMAAVWSKNYVDLELIKNSQMDDEKYGPILKSFLSFDKNAISKAAQKKYILLPSLILALKPASDHDEPKIILPRPTAILLMCQVHAFGHASINNTITTVTAHFHIDSARTLATLIVSSCLSCVFNKSQQSKLYFPGRLERGTSPFSVITMDHLYLFDKFGSHHKLYKYVLGIHCTFSYYTAYYPLKDLTATETIKVVEHFFNTCGIPKKILTDNGATFTSSAYRNYLLRHGVTHKLQSAFSPWCHATERSNKIFYNILTILLTSLKTRDWPALMPQANQAMRTMLRRYILLDPDTNELVEKRLSPYEFLTGSPPIYTLDNHLDFIFKGSPLSAAILKCRENIQNELRLANEQQKAEMDAIDKLREESNPPLKPYDFVVYRRLPRVKYRPRFVETIYQVVSVCRRQVTIVDIFDSRQKVFSTHIRHLKKVTIDSDIFNNIPTELKNHMGGGIKLPSPPTVHSAETKAKLPPKPQKLPPGLRSEWSAPAPNANIRITRRQKRQQVSSTSAPSSTSTERVHRVVCGSDYTPPPVSQAALPENTVFTLYDSDSEISSSDSHSMSSVYDTPEHTPQRTVRLVEPSGTPDTPEAAERPQIPRYPLRNRNKIPRPIQENIGAVREPRNFLERVRRVLNPTPVPDSTLITTPPSTNQQTTQQQHLVQTPPRLPPIPRFASSPIPPRISAPSPRQFIRGSPMGPPPFRPPPRSPVPFDHVSRPPGAIQTPQMGTPLRTLFTTPESYMRPQFQRGTPPPAPPATRRRAAAPPPPVDDIPLEPMRRSTRSTRGIPPPRFGFE